MLTYTSLVRSSSRDTWGSRFAFETPVDNGNYTYPGTCKLLVHPLLALDNDTRLQLRLRGRNLTHDIEFFAPNVIIRVRGASARPVHILLPLLEPLLACIVDLFSVSSLLSV